MGKRSGKNRAQGRALKQKPSLLDVWMELLLGGFLALYLLFIPLRGSERLGMYSQISETKTTLFFVLMGILLFYGAIRLGVELWAWRKQGKPLTSLSPSQIAALLFLFFTVISAAASPYQANAWYSSKSHEATLTLGLYVLLFLVTSRWGVPTRRLWKVLLWSMGLFCLLCLLQALGKNPLSLYPEGQSFYDGYGKQYQGAYAGSVGNVDLVSALLALVIPLLVIPALGKQFRRTWPCWLLALGCVGLLVWLRVLCGLVGLAAGTALTLLVRCPDEKRKWLLLSYGILAVTGIALLWAVDLPVKFLHELHEILHGRAEDSFGTGRFFIWRQMLERIPNRLLTGVGPDMARFSGLEPFVRRDELGNVVYNAAGNAITAVITDAHCYPVHILYCQGLPALLSWLTLVGLCMSHWVKGRSDCSIAALGSGLACLLCAMLFCFSSIIIMPFLWLCMGLLEGKYQERTDAKASQAM